MDVAQEMSLVTCPLVSLPLREAGRVPRRGAVSDPCAVSPAKTLTRFLACTPVSLLGPLSFTHLVIPLVIHKIGD